MTIEDVKNRLEGLGLSNHVIERYSESHRFYHTEEHLLNVLKNISENDLFCNELFLAAVYHDAVYDPKALDNEEQSAKLFSQDASTSSLSTASKETVCQLILDTKGHTASSPLSQKLIDADLAILNSPFDQLIVWEDQIFKEYQFVDYRIYRSRRIEILESFNENGRLASLIKYVEHRQPLIGVFCGSLNPFHKGHLNVLQKAEKIFDKVIIAFGNNPEKAERTWDIPESITNRQIEHYSGLLTDFIQSLEQNAVVIRGLRNTSDFQFEQNQYRYLQELMPGIRIVSIFCDKEFEHISSSGIRTLEKFGKHKKYLVE